MCGFLHGGNLRTRIIYTIDAVSNWIADDGATMLDTLRYLL